MGKFIIKATPTGFKFDLKASNGEVIASSEVYRTEQVCLNGIRSVAQNAPVAHLEDQTLPGFPAAKHPKFEVYEDKSGLFRFRLKARNAQVIAISQGYTTRANCLGGVESVRKNAVDAAVEKE